MKKIQMALIVLAVILGSNSLALNAQVPVPDAAAPSTAPPIPAAPQLGANSYILVDFNSDRILVEHNADLPVEPASITKLMTAYVVFGELEQGNIKLEDLVIPAGMTAGLEPLLVLINDQKFTKTANCWGADNNTSGTNTNRIVLFRKP